jgi:hypothetical protein
MSFHDLFSRLHGLLGVKRVASESKPNIFPWSGWVSNTGDEAARWWR